MKNLKTLLIGIILCGLFITSVSAAPQLYLDAYNASLKLNMHMNGTNNGVIFTDEMGHTVTVIDTVTKTDIKHLGNASGLFNGTTSVLSIANSNDFELGSENFTFSVWVYPTELTLYNGLYRSVLISKYYSTDEYGLQIWGSSASTITSVVWGVGDTEVVAATSNLPTLNQWNQIVVERQGTTTVIYVNGNVGGTGTSINPTENSQPLHIGGINILGTLAWRFKGNIDEVGFWKGTAIPISELYPQTIEIETIIPPTATFTAVPTSGAVPLSVQFTETSTSSGTSWIWNATNVTGNNIPFTFNTTSGSPIHVFETPGNYSISLKSTNGGGSNISTQVTFVNVSLGNSITADFTISNSTGFEPLLTHFTDTSTTNEATIDAWYWDFGDGDTSTDQNPDHTYVSAGTYDVNLTITNTSLSLVSTKIQTVTVYRNPVADFSAFSTAGFAPFTTYLYDTSANLNAGPYSYYWDFGDGNTSTEQGSLHTWNETGSFTVRHSVTDSITTRWENKTDYITVVPAVVAPTASFYGGPQLGAPPLRVFLTDVSTGSPTGWNWSMGDGTYSESQNPSHIYATSGFFTVSLTTTNSAGSNTTTQSNFVMVY